MNPDTVGRNTDKLDFHQLKHLFKASVKLDWRSAAGFQSGGSIGKFPPLLFSTFFYVFMGGAIALMVGFIPSPFIAAVLLLSISMVFSAIQVLLEFGTIIISPEDFDIISPLPVNSRTFFFSKIANLFFFTMLVTVSLGLPPLITYGVKTASALNALLLLIALMSSSCTMALAMGAVYTSLLKVVSRERLSAILNYVQVGLATIVYMGYFLASKLLREELMSLQEIDDWWLYLIPSTWYASILGLNGLGAPGHWIWSLGIGVVFTAGLYLTTSRYLSMSYSESIAKSESTKEDEPERDASISKRWSWVSRVLNPEESVILTLIKAQFKHDNRFKMTVLAIVPLTVMYLVMAMSSEGGLVNPFSVTENGDTMHSALVFMALGLFPMMVQSALVYTKTYQASWVFFATPADIPKLILATRKLVRIFFLLPITILFAIVFSYIYGNPIHALLTMLVVYFLSQTSQSTVYLTMPEVPFSRPVEKAASGVRVFGLGIFVPVILIMAPMSIVLMSGWSSWISYAITLAAVIAVERIVDYFCRLRVRAKGTSIRFAG